MSFIDGIGPEEIGHLIAFIIVLFIASVFWVSYYRVRNNKILLMATAFTLILVKAIAHHNGFAGPHMLLMDIVVFSFIAFSIYRKKEEEEIGVGNLSLDDIPLDDGSQSMDKVPQDGMNSQETEVGKQPEGNPNLDIGVEEPAPKDHEGEHAIDNSRDGSKD